GDHNDFITVFFIMLAVYLLLRSRAPSAAGADSAADVEFADPAEQSPSVAVAGGQAPAPVVSDPAPAALVSVVPVAAVTPAVVGAPAMVGTGLGFAADPSAITPVARPLATGWVARARQAMTTGAQALRPHL